MADYYTIGEFGTSLSEISNALDAILERLNECDPNVELDTTPGRTGICQGPIIVGGVCVAPEVDNFRVADLVETVEGLRDWVNDVTSKLSVFDPSAALDSTSWPIANEASDE